jgi:hypothetical protein
VIVGLIALLALGLPGAAVCLARDAAVVPPTAVFDSFRSNEGEDPCLPHQVRATEPTEPLQPPVWRTDAPVPLYDCEADGCWGWAGVGERAPLSGAGASIEVWQPEVGPGEHSLAALSIRGGEHMEEVLEIGWAVSPRRRPDGRPFLLVQRWSGGELLPHAGGFRAWSSGYAAGMDLSPWIGRSIRVGWFLDGDRWWAWFEGAWLGWFPVDAWKPPLRVGRTAQWFGEVFFTGPSPTRAMGNGRHASAKDAARFDGLCTVKPGGARCRPPGALVRRVTDPERYGYILESSTRFRYGGPGAPAAEVTPRRPPSSASGETPAERGTSGTSPPR